MVACNSRGSDLRLYKVLVYVLTQAVNNCPHIPRSGDEREDVGMAVLRGTKGDPALKGVFSN